jgi:hypothetical protein
MVKQPGADGLTDCEVFSVDYQYASRNRYSCRALHPRLGRTLSRQDGLAVGPMVSQVDL